MENLVGKRILIVDEVDDTRTTLEYAVKELEKDVEAARKKLGAAAEGQKTTFSIFVLHVRISILFLIISHTSVCYFLERPRTLGFLRAFGIEFWTRLTITLAEQEQEQERSTARRNDRSESISSCTNSRR